MNCSHWEERIALYAGGDLASAEAGEVERHLAGCAACRDWWSGLRETLAVLHDEHHTEIPAAHFTAVRASVFSEIERGRRLWRRLAWVSGVGIAAALMLGIALRPGPLPAPPARVAVRIPPAPPAPRVVTAAVAKPRAIRPIRTARREPLLVKLQTADPKIVIYWIAD